MVTDYMQYEVRNMQYEVRSTQCSNGQKIHSITMSRVTQEKTMNYGKVVDSLSEKQHEWNIELFFY